jgi:foldase protein PrsA
MYRNEVFMKRIISCVLVCAMAVMMLAACGDDNTKLVLTTGFGKDEVFTIGDESCKKNELMVYLVTVQNQYESVYGEEIWNASLDGVTLEDNVKDTVLARIAQIKTMSLLAKENNVELDEDELAKADSAAEEYFNSLNDTEKNTLDINKNTLVKMYSEYALADKVYREIIKDINPEISDDEARIIKVQHIFFSTTMKDGSGKRVDYTEREKQSVYDKAENVREMALSGEYSFEDLASRYSDDSSITLSFGKGEMEEAVENAAFNLETDEISEIVEGDTGYHIFKCISTFDREETDANKLVIVEKRKDEVFGQKYDTFVNTLVKNLNEKLWDEITLVHDENVDTSDFFEIYDRYFGQDAS